MKRLFFCILIILGVVIVFGCAKESNENEWTMEGTVAKVDDRTILIYEKPDGEISVLTEEEVKSKSISASYFVFDQEISGVEVGDKVKVWYDAIDKKLPGSGHGTKIELLK